MTRRRAVHEREDRVIGELCACLSIRDNIPVRVLCRPDRMPSNERACDAIIQRGTRQVAVEHTRIYAAPEKPRVVKVLDFVSPVIRDRVVTAFPGSLVRVAIPVEDFVRGKPWLIIAARIADLCIDALADAELGRRFRLEVEGLGSPVMAEHLKDDLPTGHCWVCPVVWGRDPEELTVDVIGRALAEKREGMRRYREAGLGTLLILDNEDYMWFIALLDLFGRALTLQDASAYDEIYLAASGDQPSFIVPLKLGERAPVWQPELGEFIGLREEIVRRRGGSPSQLISASSLRPQRREQPNDHE